MKWERTRGWKHGLGRCVVLNKADWHGRGIYQSLSVHQKLLDYIVNDLLGVGGKVAVIEGLLC
jgi:hypothetical protein